MPATPDPAATPDDPTHHGDDDQLDDESTAPRRHKPRGSILAAGMLGLDQALGRKVREEAPVVIAANDDPIDIDEEGISVDVDSSTRVLAPAQPREDRYAPKRRRRSKRT